MGDDTNTETPNQTLTENTEEITETTTIQSDEINTEENNLEAIEDNIEENSETTEENNYNETIEQTNGELNEEIVDTIPQVLITPSVSVDKEDYLPNDTVNITGNGYTAGKTLLLRIVLPNGSFEDNFVKVDDDGTINYTYNLVNGMMAIYQVQIIDLSEDSILATCSFKDNGGVLEVGTGKPFSSIQQAVNAALPGAIIKVYPGTYTSNFCGPTPTGTQVKPPHWGDNDCWAPPLIVWKDNLTIEAVDSDPENTIIKCTNDLWSNPVAIQASTGGTLSSGSYSGAGVNPDFGTAPNVISIIANNVIIRGFKLMHINPASWNTAGVMIGGLYAGDDGNYQVKQDGANYTNFVTGGSANGNTIENCIFENLWHAVYIWHSDNNIIKNNTVKALGNTGHWAAFSVYDGYNDTQINLSNGSQGNQFLNNDIYNKGIAIGAWAPSINTNNSNTKIIGNKATSIGITYSNSDNVCIKDNYIHGTTNPSTIWSYKANITHDITSSATSGGSITPTGTLKVGFKSTQTFNISPNTGYYIADVIVDGQSVGPVSSYIFQNITCTHNIQAVFGYIPGTLNLQKVDSTNPTKPVGGATYEIRDSASNLVGTITTASDGWAYASGLPWDTFSIKEIIAPPGYTLDPTTYFVSFDATSTTVWLYVKDTPIAAGPAITTTLGVAGIQTTGIEVAGLAFTGIEPIFPIAGLSIIVSGIGIFITSILRKRKR